MKEIDFLPEWYKEGRRRKVNMRRQCLALGLIFVTMIVYNTLSAHRIAVATATLEQLEDHRMRAETVLSRFEMLSHELNDYQAEVNSLARMDSRMDPVAVIAEISHLIGTRVVLSRIEFTAEPVNQHDQKRARGASVRAADGGRRASQPTLLGDVKFQIVLAGVAASATDAADLVSRLEESAYFQHVRPSGFRNTTLDVSMGQQSDATGPQSRPTGGDAKISLRVSEFQITCYLANFDEIESE